MKKVLFLLSICLLTSFSAKAQAGIYALGYANYQKIQSKTFSQFVNSYNSEMSGTPQIRYGFSARLELQYTTMALEYNQAATLYKVVTSSGERKMLLSDRATAFVFGLHSGSFYPELGISLGSNAIESTFTPASGSPSTATLLSGNYKTSLIASNLILGVTYKLKLLPKVYLLGRARYHFALAGTDLEDENQGFDTQSLPLNVPLFLASPRNYSGDFVQDDFKGLRFSLGLAVLLYDGN